MRTRLQKLLQDEFAIKEGVRDIIKKTYSGSGRSGGRQLQRGGGFIWDDRMFGLGLSMDGLMERGVKLGADVPYCIMRGTVLAEGIGEARERSSFYAEMYGAYCQAAGQRVHPNGYEALDAQEIAVHPDIDGIIAGLESGDLRAITDAMGNVLENVTIPMHPVIKEIKNEMKAAGALNAMMSGSGPTVFGLFESRIDAKNAQKNPGQGTDKTGVCDRHTQC